MTHYNSKLWTDPVINLALPLFTQRIRQMRNVQYNSSLIRQYCSNNNYYKLTVDFGEVKTVPTECKEKCFQITSSAYLLYSKAAKHVLMLMILLRKRSGR